MDVHDQRGNGACRGENPWAEGARNMRDGAYAILDNLIANGFLTDLEIVERHLHRLQQQSAKSLTVNTAEIA